MANKKFTDLTAADTITGAEILALVQSGNSRKAALTAVKTYFDTQYAPVVGYAKISDTKAANTNGGTFTASAWQTRTINTEDSDADDIVSISANQFTLQAGTYRIYASAPAYAVNSHKAKLRNISDGSDTIIGTTEYGGTAGGSPQTRSVVNGQFTIASAKTFEIQHYCTSTTATNGFGVAANVGVSEVYTIVELWKVA